ncbi:MAG: sulfurtransferase [Pirellulaceae bacterium]
MTTTLSYPPTPKEPSSAANILNIAAYKFVPLDDLDARRQQLKRFCDGLKLRGTILLSPEGINLFMAGDEASIRQFVSELRNDPNFADLAVKESYSTSLPFRRMLVRLKREIISFGVESVKPLEHTSPKLPAKELRRWLDEGRSVRLLDTRNDYEVDLGTFVGAEHLSISHFREFPRAIEQLPEEAKHEPLVMFCTGGIRCEKAGPLMEQAGFEQVYQLDGGILKYFEECGGAHYDGSCFVFDGRVALDPQLRPTGNLLCFACQAVLTPEDVTSNKFLFGKHCPRCFVPPAEQRKREFEKRRHLIRMAAAAQPGCQPYDNLRQIHVAGKFAGWPLLDFLDAYQPAIGREQWQQWIMAGDLRRADQNQSTVASPAAASAVVTLETIVKEGQCFEQHMPDTIEPPINPNIELLYEDDSLIVVCKPAPLPTHPSGRFNKNTLLAILAGVYPNEKLRVAHRLDASTSGVVVLCRKHQSARFVQPQFELKIQPSAQTSSVSESASQVRRQRAIAGLPPVQKRYTARVYGHPEWQSTICEAAIAHEPGPAGNRAIAEQGQPACTEFKVLQKLADGTALLEAIPRTGRTHQIRLHLWHLGFPIVGDPLYHRNRQTGGRGTVAVDEPPMCLHARFIAFTHPESRQLVDYEAPVPSWGDPAQELAAEL